MIMIQVAEMCRAPEMALLHALCFREDVWTKAQIEGSLDLPTTKAWIAKTDDDVLVGLLVVQIAGQEAEILTFCVAPECRLQGVGGKLLQELFTETKGFTLHLEVAADNEAACRLYQKMGFVEAGRRPSYYKRGEKTVDGVRYVRNLNTHT